MREQWEKALAAEYYWELGDTSDVQARLRLSVVICNSADRTRLGLTKAVIEAPDGTRNISMDEAGGLAHFISEAVIDTINQVKAYRPDMD